MAPKSVVITGAAGFIGSHLAERCLKLGWAVTAIDCFTDYYPERLKRRNIAEFMEHPQCRFIEADLLNIDLARVLDAAQIVFHLAAQPGVRASWDEFERYSTLNLCATQRLLGAATRQTSLEKVVIASSSSVYGDAEAFPTPEGVVPRPVSPYGVTKVATEHLARVYWRNFRLPTVCLRYFTVYGPRQRPDMAFHRLITHALTSDPFPVFGDGNQTRDFTFVEDAVAGTVAAAHSGTPGGVYNIGGGSRRSLNSVFEALNAVAGVDVSRVNVASQAGDARDTAADISRAQKELGYYPTTSFESGLRKQLEWQRAVLKTLEVVGDY